MATLRRTFKNGGVIMEKLKSKNFLFKVDGREIWVSALDEIRAYERIRASYKSAFQIFLIKAV